MSGIVSEPVNVAFESAVQRIVDRKRKDESAVDFLQRVIGIRRALCPDCTHWKHEHESPRGCSRCVCRAKEQGGR